MHRSDSTRRSRPGQRPRRALAALAPWLARCRGRVLATLLAGAPLAHAAAWQVEAGVGHEALDGGRGSWRQADLALRGEVAPRIKLAALVRRTERFGLADDELGLRLDFARDGGWSHAVAATLSPTRRVLARGSITGEARRALDDGWVAGATLRHARYAASGATTVGADLERYFGSAAFGEWRAAGGLTATHLAGTTGAGARAQIDRFFDRGGRLGLIVSTGREPDTLEDGSVRVARVDTVAVVARWPLATGWWLVGDLGHTRVGGAYRRSGGRLGVQLDL